MITDLGAHEWQALWDGETLEGWRKIGPGDWTIESGTIVGRHTASDREHGHLISTEVFDDFTMRLQYRIFEGNSGVYFRVEEGGGAGVLGFQAEVDGAPDAFPGGLYETGGRAWVVPRANEDFKSHYIQNEWNTMAIMASGRDVAVELNGRISSLIHDDPGRLTGRFAFQLHGSQDVHLALRNIEILVKEEGDASDPEASP